MRLAALSYEERAAICPSSLAKRLLSLLDSKKTNLCLSADVTHTSKLIELADELGPEICVLKTHVDILDDFSIKIIEKLRQLANKHHFFLFEDRKFADIGNTVQHQYSGGIYRIADWAHIVNAHAIVGPGVLRGLSAVKNTESACLLISELSSSGHLMTADYAKQTLALAQQFQHFVIGFISQQAPSNDPKWINFTPGIQLESGQDTLGQRYVTPEQTILENGTDIIIVGRGILSSPQPLAAAKIYRERGFKAYLRRLNRIIELSNNPQ